MRQRVHWLLALACLVGVISACGKDAQEPAAAMRIVALTDRTCEKDQEALEEIAYGWALGDPCTTDMSCACGSYCGPDGRCVVDCLDDDPSLACQQSDEVCNGFGKCAVPQSVPEPNEQLAIMAIEPTSVELPPRDANTEFQSTELTISLRVDDFDPSDPPSPRVEASGALEAPDCVPSSTTPCPDPSTSELELQCEPSGEFTNRCILEDGWSFTPDGDGFVATRSIVVRPRLDAEAEAWVLRVISDDATPSPQMLTLTSQTVQPIAFEGRYRGSLQLTPQVTGTTQPPRGLRLPVEAYAVDDRLVLLDPAQVLSRSGSLELTRDADFRMPWVVSDGGTDLSVGVRSIDFSHDDETGSIVGTMELELPGLAEVPDWPSNDNPLVHVGFELGRRSDLPAERCTGDADCPLGTLCEAGLQLCLSNPLTTTESETGPYSYSHSARFLEWAWGMMYEFDDRGAIPGHLTGDTAERVICYPENRALDLTTDQLGVQVASYSGDLRCGDGTDSVLAPLTSAPQAVGMNLGDVFEACLTELDAEPAVDLGRPSCLSMARFAPALALLMLSDLGTDTRKPALFQYLLRTWLATHGTVARQAVEHLKLQRTSSSDEYTPEELHDLVARGWDLMLDDQVFSALGRLGQASLFDPDYRYTNRPRGYLPNLPSTTVIGNASLRNLAGGELIELAFDDGEDIFAGDLSLHLSTRVDTVNSRETQSLFEGEGLSIEIDKGGWSLFAKDTARRWDTADQGSYNYTSYHGTSGWPECQQRCAGVWYAQVWSYEPEDGLCQCGRYDGEALPGVPGARSGRLRDQTDYSPLAHTTDTNYTRWGGDYSSFIASGLSDCQTRCDPPYTTSSHTCMAYAYRHSDRRCWLKGGRRPDGSFELMPLAYPATGITSGKANSGFPLERALAHQIDDNVDRVGGDYRSFGATRWDMCAEACATEDRCKAWSYSKSARHCWLKSRVPGQSSNQHSVSAVKPTMSLVVRHAHAEGEDTVILSLDREAYFEGSLTLVRDQAAHNYRLYVDDELVSTASYTHDPVAADPRLRFGRLSGDESLADAYLPVYDVALFDTALDGKAVEAIELRREDGDTTPVIHDRIDGPLPDGVEAQVGLPVAILETLEAEVELLDKLIIDRQGALATSCGTVEQAELRSVTARAGEALRRGVVLQTMAQSLFERATVTGWIDEDEPEHVTPNWQDRYERALSGYEASRAQTLELLSERASCAPTLGIDEAALPLYFYDPEGQAARYFASSNYLFSMADKATSDAEDALANARNAMLAYENLEFEDAVGSVSSEARIEGLQKDYAGKFQDLCGFDSNTVADMFDDLEDQSFRDSCFVKRTSQCLSNFEGPVSEAQVSCYRGTLGEAYLTLRRMTHQVEAAKQISDAKLAELERQSTTCLDLEENEALMTKHFEHMDRLRKRKAAYDKIVKVFGLGGQVAGRSLASALSEEGGSGGATFDPVTSIEVYTSIVTGVFSFMSSNIAKEMKNEQRVFEETMALRSAAQKVQACWNTVDSLRDHVLGTEKQIRLAVDAFEDATLRFANGRMRMERLVASAVTDIERERDRTISRPQHIYWLDEAVSTYDSRLERAKYLTYLTLRATEYEFQISLGLERDILDARGPEQLRQSVEVLGEEISAPSVNGTRPQEMYIVLDLAQDILGFEGSRAEIESQLQAFLQDRAQRFVDENGVVKGQGVRFELTPQQTCVDNDLCLPLPDRCGERLWSVTAKVTGGPIPTMTSLRLEKSTSFYSQWCVPEQHGGGTQGGYIRPRDNLFRRDSVRDFQEEPTALRADLQVPLSGPQDIQDENYGFEDDTFAGQGLYGDYALWFADGDSSLQLDQVTSVKLRFDFLSVAANLPTGGSTQ